MAEPAPLPMFPLESALLPGEELPLRIFELRYITLVTDCMRSTDPHFGVVMISRGREVGGGEQRCDIGAVANINECSDLGSGRYSLRCRMGERIRVSEWLPDDPYPRAMVTCWPDEPGPEVSETQLRELENRIVALFKRIAVARGRRFLPSHDVLLGTRRGGADLDDPGKRLYALASRIPMGQADFYAVLSAPSAADRLAALSDAVDSVAEVVEFQLSQ
jgi:Lon protease-like protein